MILGDGSRVVDLRKAHIEGGGAVLTVSDISDRKQAEQAMSDQKAVLDTVMDNMDQGILMANGKLRIMAYNETMCTLTGLPLDALQTLDSFPEIMEYLLRDKLKLEDWESHFERSMETARSQEYQRYEARLADKDVEVRQSALDDGGFVRTFTDITERKEAENQLKDAFNVISSSIDYASRIQRSVLPDDTLFSSLLTDHFVLWKPRDVVGGDIYWSRMWGDGFLIILGDCTGHGVPGAFMTLIATGALDNAISDVPGGQVADLMQRLHQLVQVTLGQHGEGAEADDGMELGMCYFGPEMDNLIFVGARFELYLVENGTVSIIKGNKNGIGYHGISHTQEYDEHEIVNLSGKSFYMTSDGLIDQVGGERRRMYGKKRFRELLLSLQDKPIADQKMAIYKELLDYQGDENRRDDVAVIGFKV